MRLALRTRTATFRGIQPRSKHVTPDGARDIWVPLFRGFPGKNPVIRRQNIPSVSTLLRDASYERHGCQRRGALSLRPCRSPTPFVVVAVAGSAQSRSSYRRARLVLSVRVRSHPNIASVIASRRKCERRDCNNRVAGLALWKVRKLWVCPR